MEVECRSWAANGGRNSRWSVVNTSANPLSCTLDLVGPDGQPVSLNTTAGSGNSIPFAAGSVQSGASSVSCSGAFVADVTYSWMPNGVALTEVTVPPRNRFLNHVLAANAFTGLAMYEARHEPIDRNDHSLRPRRDTRHTQPIRTCLTDASRAIQTDSEVQCFQTLKSYIY